MGNREAAVQFHNKAVHCINNPQENPQHLTTAYQLFSSACLADPTWFDAWYQCGNNNSDLGRYDAAVANWRLALETSDGDKQTRAKALANLGWRLHDIGHVREGLDKTLDALDLDPTLHLAYCNLCRAHTILGSKIAALEAARKAVELAPFDNNCQIALAFACLFNGDYAEGFRHFEARFEWKLKAFTQYPYPRWSGEPGKTVFCVAEQGLGDTISFAKFIEAAADRCQYMHLYLQAPLLRLFQHTFMHLKNVNLIPAPAMFPHADYWTTFNSLPYALGLSNEQIRNAPEIRIPTVRAVNTSWLIPDRKFHIGIAWRGSHLNDIDKYRNIPLEMFFNLYQVPGAALYSLQVGEHAKDVYDLGAAALVRDLTPYISDVMDTLSLLQHLDLVISVESAMGHICTLANKECWHPYSRLGKDWRLGASGEMMLWRPASHRLFHQGHDPTWQTAFDQIVEALREKVKCLS